MYDALRPPRGPLPAAQGGSPPKRGFFKNFFGRKFFRKTSLREFLKNPPLRGRYNWGQVRAREGKKEDNAQTLHTILPQLTVCGPHSQTGPQNALKKPPKSPTRAPARGPEAHWTLKTLRQNSSAPLWRPPGRRPGAAEGDRAKARPPRAAPLGA